MACTSEENREADLAAREDARGPLTETMEAPFIWEDSLRELEPQYSLCPSLGDILCTPEDGYKPKKVPTFGKLLLLGPVCGNLFKPYTRYFTWGLIRPT